MRVRRTGKNERQCKPEHRGSSGTNPYGRFHGVTCAAVVALWNAGQYDTDLIRRTIDFMNRNIRHDFVSGHHAEYVEYYLAQAKWIVGGREWMGYYRPAASRFVQIQQPDGHWEGSDHYQYGITFGTAIALIILQLPYNRLPVYQR